jgi:hypothetical protein
LTTPRVTTTHLHPLLGLADRLQMPSYRCRIDQVIRQQLDPATTTRGGFGHRCRADGLRVLDLRGANGHLQSGFWQRGSLLSSNRHGGLSGGHLHCRCFRPATYYGEYPK